MKNQNAEKKSIHRYIQIGLVIVIIILGIDRLALFGEGTVLGSGNDTLSRLAVEYYVEQNNGVVDQEGLEAKVINFGCHKEIHVFKDGELVMRTGFSRGQIYQID